MRTVETEVSQSQNPLFEADMHLQETHLLAIHRISVMAGDLTVPFLLGSSESFAAKMASSPVWAFHSDALLVRADRGSSVAKPRFSADVVASVRLRLSSTALSWRIFSSSMGSTAETTSINLSDIVGARSVRLSSSSDNSEELHVFVYSEEEASAGCCAGVDRQVGVLRPRKQLAFRFRSSSAISDDSSAANDVWNVVATRVWAACISWLARGEQPPPAALAWLAANTADGGYGAGSAAPTQSLSAAAAAALHPPPRRLLVLVNPVSGQGRGVALFESHCRPMLEDAGCEVDAIVTTHAGHATQHIASLPSPAALTYDGIVGVGGDGALAEVVAGVMGRRDWAALTRRAALGILPGGSGNGLAVSFLAAAGLPYSLGNAALLIAKHRVGRMDVASAFIANDTSQRADRDAAAGTAAGAAIAAAAASHSGAGEAKVALAATAPASVAAASAIAGASAPTPAPGDRVATSGPSAAWGGRHWQFLSTSWAIVSDVDIESESLRCLGAARFDVYGALRACCLRTYRGRFHYLPADDDDGSGDGSGGTAAGSGSYAIDVAAAAGAGAGAGTAAGARAAAAGAAVASTGAGKGDDASSGKLLAGAGAVAVSIGGAGADETSPAAPPIRFLHPFNESLPASEGWRTIEGGFTLLYVTNSSHQSLGVSAAPGTRHDDGVMTVAIVQETGPCTMVFMLLGLDNEGSFVAAHHDALVPGGVLRRFRARAFRLEPEMNPSVSRRGHVSLDGEDVAYGPVQAELHPRLLRVFAP